MMGLLLRIGSEGVAQILYVLNMEFMGFWPLSRESTNFGNG